MGYLDYNGLETQVECIKRYVNSKTNMSPNTTSKAYLTGTTSSTANAEGQIFDTGVYLTETPGQLRTTTLITAGNITMGGTANTSYLQLPSGIKLF